MVSITHTRAVAADPVTAVFKAVDQTRNSTETLADDDDLVVAVEADGIYAVEGVLKITSGSTPDFKWQFTVPSGAAIDGQTVTNLGGTINPFTEAAADVFETDGNDNTAPFWAVLVVDSTAGNLTLQWAQNASDVGDTTLKAGSWMTVRKLN